MSIGFEIKEIMSGHDLESNEPFEFEVTWGLSDIKNLFKRGLKKFHLNGKVLFNGAWSECQGYLIIDYFRTHTIQYVFFFPYPGHDNLLYVGNKINIKPWNLLTSHTTCFGTITAVRSDIFYTTTVTYFKFRTIPKFLSSFRLIRTK